MFRQDVEDVLEAMEVVKLEFARSVPGGGREAMLWETYLALQDELKSMQAPKPGGRRRKDDA